MRTELLIGCKSKREARKLLPWAAVIRKVDGGYMGWESMSNYKLWMAQR